MQNFPTLEAQTPNPVPPAAGSFADSAPEKPSPLRISGYEPGFNSVELKCWICLPGLDEVSSSQKLNLLLIAFVATSQDFWRVPNQAIYIFLLETQYLMWEKQQQAERKEGADHRSKSPIIWSHISTI